MVIRLVDYDSFVSDALEQFRQLPEEKDELYKRHFVSLPLIEMTKKLGNRKVKSNEQKIKERVKRIGEGLQTKFDALVWSDGSAMLGSSGYAKITPTEKIGSGLLESKMFKSGEDKTVAFVHAHAKRMIRIRIPKQTDAKVNLLFLNTNKPLLLQVFIDVGEGASLGLFEYRTSEASEASLLGLLHEIRMAKRSSADINMLHNEDNDTIGIGLTKAVCSDSSSLRMNFVYNGGASTRSKNRIDLSGHAAQTEISELIVGSGEQRFDITTSVVNSARDSGAVLESRAVLMDRSICLLKGSAEITKYASGSRSHVNERGVMLDRDVHIDSIPSMRIGNNDVEATHSSATAPIEEEQLFYLMSRGASELLAKKMIVSGFLSSGIARLNDIIAREIVASIVNEKMTTRRFGTVPRITTESMWLDESARKGAGASKDQHGDESE